MTGYEPEKMIPAGGLSALGLAAKRLAELQSEKGSEAPHLDPALVSVYVGAAVYGLITMHPWLMASAGLPPEDYEDRIDEIIEVGVAFLAMVMGVRP